MKDDRFDSGIDIRHEVLRTRSYIMNDTICIIVSKENWTLLFARAVRIEVKSTQSQCDYLVNTIDLLTYYWLIMKKLNLSFFVLYWFWNSVILYFHSKTSLKFRTNK